MSKRDFLLEIGMEEMPARFVTDAMNQLKDAIASWLKKEAVEFDGITAYSTPRRLAVIVSGMVEKQADTEEEARGPAKKIALDENGEWTKAALGFARGQGVEPSELYFAEQKGVEYVFAKKFTVGQEMKHILPQVEATVKGLHFPKNMRWNNYDFRYVRPIHWLVALFGDEVIPFEITNVKSNRVTRGHRFLGKEVEIKTANEYVEALRFEHVIVDPSERKQLIREQIAKLASENDWIIPIDEDLLEEVNNLVELPTALYGSFDESFLEVPEEVLITSMREHQRYFPVQNKDGKLLAHFVTVRNGNREHLDNVRSGNEKVIRARLSDAVFFYREDQKRPIDDFLAELENIVYHEDLGSLADKVRRIEEHASRLSEVLQVTETDKVSRAAKLCKFDLVTQMVYEFPELQGRMGEDYALKADEDETVARAIFEHYMPRFSGDASPETMVGTIVSLADKLDTITTCFGIGLIPTGSQDPYALRRQAAGIVQMILDHKLDVELEQLLGLSLDIAEKNGVLKRNRNEVLTDLVNFFKLRVKNVLQEKGIRYDVIEAVSTEVVGKIDLIVKKAEYLAMKLEEPTFKGLVETLSRVTNIAKKAAEKANSIDASLFEKDIEQILYDVYVKANEKLHAHLSNKEVEQAYIVLESLQGAINDYFEQIMVMADNEAVKQNRLSQMKALASVIMAFANFQAIVFTH